MILKFDRGDGSFHLFQTENDSVVFSDQNTVYRSLGESETLDEYFDSFKPCNLGAVQFYKTTESASKFMNVFFGNRHKDERFCMKRISFIGSDTEYCIYTEFPVFVCTNDGKTVEKIK